MSTVEIIKLLWPVLLLQILFQIYALVDLFRHGKTKTLSVAAWAVIIILGEILGPIAYFIFGKDEE